MVTYAFILTVRQKQTSVRVKQRNQRVVTAYSVSSPETLIYIKLK